MPRGLYNQTAEEIVRFLKEYGFRHTYTKGSHFYYFGKYNEKDRQVCVPFHGKKTIKPRTLKGIISQSGVPKKKWLNR